MKVVRSGTESFPWLGARAVQRRQSKGYVPSFMPPGMAAAMGQGGDKAEGGAKPERKEEVRAGLPGSLALPWLALQLLTLNP